MSERMGWTRRDVLKLIGEIDATFPSDWSPNLTVVDVVHLWLLARKRESSETPPPYPVATKVRPWSD